MRILIAPQGFKGCLDAWAVAEAIERGIKTASPAAETILLPIADGGEGTVRALVKATGGQFKRTIVHDPLGGSISAEWGVMGDGCTAVIEMAAASGLQLVEPEKRNPLVTTTYGTGELIKTAVDEGYRRCIIGVGGSATNDGGAGMAQALGIRLLDAGGRDLTWGGASLISLATIDTAGLDQGLRQVEILIASDVTNPLAGPQGASHVYGPQKGATPEMADQLDAALQHYGEVIRDQLGIEIRDRPGAGAAGGLGGGLIAFLNARLVSGAELVLREIGFEKHLKDADVVFTGEGQMDSQTIYGKAPIAVARAAKSSHLPVVAIVGGTSDDHDVVYQHGIDAVISITQRPMDLRVAMEQANALIATAAERAVRLMLIGQGIERRQRG